MLLGCVWGTCMWVVGSCLAPLATAGFTVSEEWAKAGAASLQSKGSRPAFTSIGTGFECLAL